VTYVLDDDQSHLVGFAATCGEELLHFGTAVHTWGSELAAAAHAEIIHRLGQAGVTRAHLRVFEGNGGARRFYEKLGWCQNGRTSRTSFPPHPVLVEYDYDL
jgi:RimJ/RimL family protein N-acetyltransferase